MAVKFKGKKATPEQDAKNDEMLSHAKEQEKKVEVDHTNPFNKGVTYKSFLKAIGNKKPKDVLKDVCSKEQIDWIETELENYNNSK